MPLQTQVMSGEVLGRFEGSDIHENRTKLDVVVQI